MFRRESTFALDDIFLKDWKEVKLLTLIISWYYR